MIKVVVADDNEILLKQIVKALKQSNEIDIVGVAKNGEEELEYIKQLYPDVVVTDIEMPKMTGVEVIEIVKNFENAPEFIVITGGASSEIMKRLYELPIRNIYNKPIDMQKLVSEIERCKIEEQQSPKINLHTEEKSLFKRFKNFLNK